MAPPLPNPSKRMTANPARPVSRYRPGKAVQEEVSSEEDGSENDTGVQGSPGKPQPKATSFPAGAQRRQIPVRSTREGESEDEEGFVTDDECEDNDGVAGLPTVGLIDDTSRNAPKTTEPATSRTTEAAEAELTEEGESDQSEDDSQESEESSSGEEPQRKFQRPVFIKKSNRHRATFAAGNESLSGVQDASASVSSPQDAMLMEEARRKEVTDFMIKDKLERDAITRVAGRKGWDDNDEIAAEETVDDTDGVDPEAEYAAWKLRELKRLKRDREAIEQREREIEEIERRRNLTQAERDAEDRDYLQQQKEEREEGRGKAGFLQTYHHKGAFFQDDETAEALRKRDLMGARYVDEVQNREALPHYMQVRDMTKLGKKGRTRYTDLKGEDTGKWGQGYVDKERKDLKMDFAMDERFRPDRDGGAKGPTGANASTIQDRRDRKIDAALPPPLSTWNDNQSRSTDDRDGLNGPGLSSHERTEHDGRARRHTPSPRRRRSSSTPRPTSTGRHGYEDEEGRSRRKRSPSYQNREKRRRVEATRPTTLV